MINSMTILMVKYVEIKNKDSFNVDNQGIKIPPLCYRWIHSMTIRNPIISIRVEKWHPLVIAVPNINLWAMASALLLH
jgi:hypothetical protein